MSIQIFCTIKNNTVFLKIKKNLICFIFGCAGYEWGLLCSCDERASHCGGFFCCGAQALEGMGFSCGTWLLSAGLIVAHGLSCSRACGILPDQGSNPCPLHWQADSLPLNHHGSPSAYVLFKSQVLISFFHYHLHIRDFPSDIW